MTKNAYSIGKSRLIDIQFLSKTIFFLSFKRTS